MTEQEFAVLNRALSVASTAVQSLLISDPNSTNYPTWLQDVAAATDVLIAVRTRASLAEMNERINSQPYKRYSPEHEPSCSCGKPDCSCEHGPNEDCMICAGCGRCAETCDEENELCDECRGAGREA